MSNSTVRQIVVEWLKEHGYDGLYNYECGCSIDNLMLCNEVDVRVCQAGYRVFCVKCWRLNTSDCPQEGWPCEHCIMPNRPGDATGKESDGNDDGRLTQVLGKRTG